MNKQQLIYKKDYYGYVYLWYDRKHRRFCLGSHHGSVEDSYITSTGWMMRAYKKRPEDFRMRVLAYNTINIVKETRKIEQHYLNMIDERELSISKNVIDGTNRYYNMSKNALGGSQKGAIYNRTKPAWNKGISSEMLELRRNGLLCLLMDKPKMKLPRKQRKKQIKHPYTRIYFLIDQRTGELFCSKKKNKKYKEMPPKRQVEIICKQCGKITVIDYKERDRKYCNKICYGLFRREYLKGENNPFYGKTHTTQTRKKISNANNGKEAWNKGLPNPTAAENGQKGALAQSRTVTGRKRKYKEDGSWFWIYPNKNGGFSVSKQSA